MTLEQTADRLFSRFIRDRDGSCQGNSNPATTWTECYPPLECAHIIRRGNGYKAVRWEPLNAVALCHGHHQWFTEHPLAWTAWASERLGGDVYAELLARARTMVRPDLRFVIADLKGKVHA